MTDAVYPNRELILSEDRVVETPRERFLNEAHKGDNALVSVVLSPRLKRNILPDESEDANIKHFGRVVDVEGKILGLDSEYAQILTKYKQVRSVPYVKEGKRSSGFRVVRIPLDRMVYYELIPFGQELAR